MSHGPFSKFSDKTLKKIERHRIKKNTFSKQTYIFCHFKTIQSIAIFKTFVKITGSYCGSVYHVKFSYSSLKFAEDIKPKIQYHNEISLRI
jgi:hypothetical protein